MLIVASMQTEVAVAQPPDNIEDDPLVAELKQSYSSVEAFLRGGQPDSAMAVAQVALEKARKEFGDIHESVAYFLNLIGKAHFAQQRLHSGSGLQHKSSQDHV